MSENENSLIYGNDEIKVLQKRLLFLGFSGLGLADGYYNVKTAEIIKLIKTLLGFKLKDNVEPFLATIDKGRNDFLKHAVTNNIEKQLWDIIFNENYESILKIISIISSYDYDKLLKNDYSIILYLSDGGSISAQYANESRIFRIKHYSIKLNIDMDYIIYDKDKFFVVETYYLDTEQTTIFMARDNPHPIRTNSYHIVYYQDEKGTFKIVDGIISEIDKHYEIERIFN